LRQFSTLQISVIRTNKNMIQSSYSKFNQSMNIFLIWFILLLWWWWWWWYRKNTLNHNLVVINSVFPVLLLQISPSEFMICVQFRTRALKR